MKIGIYARGLSGIGGVKQYIDAMCRSMIEHVSDDDELHIFHPLNTPYFCTAKTNVHEIRLASKNLFVCDLIEAPKAINARHLDVVWFTKYVVPFGIKAKTATTIHDLGYYLPDLGAYALSDTLYMRIMIRGSVRRADRIIAVSAYTKQHIVDRLNVSAERISVVHEAADAQYQTDVNEADIVRWRKTRGLPEKFILFTGGISPRKNLIRLIQAFEKARPHIPHALVLTGGKGWRNKDILKAIDTNDAVVKLGFIPDDEMPLLYRAADLFVYPSLFEGFGLPILEAQACGTPVISSANSSITEVAGNAVRSIDPLNVDNMAAAIVETLNTPRRYRELVENGYQNIKRFSWDKAATEMLALLTSIY